MAAVDRVTRDIVHAGFRHGSTRALGCGGADLVIGDLVICVPVGGTEPPVARDHQSSRDHQAAQDYQVEMSAGGYLTVLDTVLTAWTEHRSSALPLVDSDGHPWAADSLPVPGELDADDGEGPRTCPWCTAVRGGRVPQLRGERRAATAEIRAVDDEARAARRRNALRPLPSWPVA